jgi:undecaprenyl diphosphate synthase
MPWRAIYLRCDERGKRVGLINSAIYAADLPDPDLIIRTAGEIRLSGFVLWQSVHREFYFTDVLGRHFAMLTSSIRA